MNGHKVNNVSDLHADAVKLYESYVSGSGDDSADSVLRYLGDAIQTLKDSWKGMDAGNQINSVIGVYNSMVAVRNSLAELAKVSSQVAVNYREIQISNSASLDALSSLNYDAKSNMGEYSDTADTIDITMEANNGKNSLDSACNSLDSFHSSVQTCYNNIMDNWTAGEGRDTAAEAFSSFSTNVDNYKQVLAEVSNNVATALRNYGLL